MTLFVLSACLVANVTWIQKKSLKLWHLTIFIYLGFIFYCTFCLCFLHLSFISWFSPLLTILYHCSLFLLIYWTSIHRTLSLHLSSIILKHCLQPIYTILHNTYFSTVKKKPTFFPCTRAGAHELEPISPIPIFSPEKVWYFFISKYIRPLLMCALQVIIPLTAHNPSTAPYFWSNYYCCSQYRLDPPSPTLFPQPRKDLTLVPGRQTTFRIHKWQVDIGEEGFTHLSLARLRPAPNSLLSSFFFPVQSDWWRVLTQNTPVHSLHRCCLSYSVCCS